MYIIRAKRSAIGKYNGMYKDVDLVDFSSELLKNISKDLYIEELILGNVLANNLGQNISRLIALNSNLSQNCICYLINQVCGSGLKAVELAYQDILVNNKKLVIAGGIEKMTGSENMLKDGLTDSFNNIHMGITAENIAKKYNFTRKELDDYAFLSQQRVKKAIENGYFKEEIFDDKVDEYPRLNLERSKLDTLKPAFCSDGIVTAGNASGINDGAAMLVLANKEYVKENNIDALAKIISFETYALDPLYMGLAPIYATKNLLEKNNLKIEDIDLFEINEAFSSIVLAYIKELNLDIEKVNVNGGAIALGHPIGASGARVLVSLIYELKRRNLKRGIASLCIGGGQGISILIER